MNIAKEKLRDLMIEQEMDDIDLARAVRITQPAVHYMLRTGRCRKSTLGRIIKTLGVGVRDLLIDIEEVA